jgi:hypothetical protein
MQQDCPHAGVPDSGKLCAACGLRLFREDDTKVGQSKVPLDMRRRQADQLTPLNLAAMLDDSEVWGFSKSVSFFVALPSR